MYLNFVLNLSQWLETPPPIHLIPFLGLTCNALPLCPTLSDWKWSCIFLRLFCHFEWQDDAHKSTIIIIIISLRSVTLPSHYQNIRFSLLLVSSQSIASSQPNSWPGLVWVNVIHPMELLLLPVQRSSCVCPAHCRGDCLQMKEHIPCTFSAPCATKPWLNHACSRAAKDKEAAPVVPKFLDYVY